MANVLEIEITYPNGAVRSERWELSELFCPNCGKRGCVWSEDDPGDYYVGPDYLCLACSTVFEMPSITVAGLVDRAKISALMTAHPLSNAVDQDELIGNYIVNSLDKRAGRAAGFDDRSGQRQAADLCGVDRMKQPCKC